MKKKIIITENQFKRLIENIIKEEYEYNNSYTIENIFNNPKAIALVNYLIDTTDREYGLSDLKYTGTFYGMDRFKVKDYTYLIGDKKQYLNWMESGGYVSHSMYDDYYIIKWE